VVRVLRVAFLPTVLAPSGARAATPELSTTTRLPDRRAVASGDRAYVEGFADVGHHPL
jgi:hypothetical protein